MRKLFSLVLALLMLCSCSLAFAAEIDFSGMTQDELLNVIDQARLELTKFLPAVVDGTVLYEDENVKITLNGDIYMEYGALNIPVIVENYTDFDLIIGIEDSSCNGWDVGSATVSVSAGKKAKDEFAYYGADEDAELTSAEEVQDITGTLYYFDTETYDRLYEGETATTWLFNE